MKGGIVSVMFLLGSEIPVTEQLVHVISSQVQWEVFDGVQWLMDGGDCQCCFSFSRTVCS